MDSTEETRATIEGWFKLKKQIRLLESRIKGMGVLLKNMRQEGFVDEYGDDIIDEDGVYKAKKYLLNERAGASPEDLDTLKRQYPFTPEEALFSEEHSVFPVSRINDQKA